MAIGFDRSTESNEIDIDRYKGQWILIMDGDAQSGKLVETHPDRILLMPYQAIDYLNGQPVSRIQREGLPLMIYKADIKRIRPVSEESITGYCQYINRQTYRDVLVKELDFLEKTKRIHPAENFSDGGGI